MMMMMMMIVMVEMVMLYDDDDTYLRTELPTLEPTNYIQIFYRSIMDTIYLLLCLLQEVFSVGIIIQFEFQSIRSS